MPAHTTVPVFTRSSYGNEHIYVADASLASSLCVLTRSKTLLPEHVTALKSLGFAFRLVSDPKSKPLNSALLDNS
jgi:hypothetical protein